MNKTGTAKQNTIESARATDDFVISRRELMRRMAILGALVYACPADALAGLRQVKAARAVNRNQPVWQEEPVWQTLAQVQETLFPSAKDIPGAGDFDAVVYLHRAIENPQADGGDRDFIMRGVGWLNELTRERHNRSFQQLTRQQQQQIIEVIVKSRAGRNWVSTMLTYILEAMLADPVYGGNRDGKGWAWLQHQPGYPAPPEDKTWDKLLQRRYSL